MFLFFADSTDSLKVNKRLNTYVHSIIPPNLWNFVVVVVIRFAFSSSSLEILINFISLEEFRAAKTMLHSLRIQILQVARNLLDLLYSGWCRRSSQIRTALYSWTVCGWIYLCSVSGDGSVLVNCWWIIAIVFGLFPFQIVTEHRTFCGWSYCLVSTCPNLQTWKLLLLRVLD
jgi:hypothetical protein